VDYTTVHPEKRYDFAAYRWSQAGPKASA